MGRRGRERGLVPGSPRGGGGSRAGVGARSPEPPPGRPRAWRPRRVRCGGRPPRQNHHREGHQHQRDATVEAPSLRVRPGVQRPDHFAPAVRVGARVLARAAVADVRLGPVAHEPALGVELMGPEVLALGALPGVLVRVVGEARRAVTQRAPVGVRRQPFERAGAEQQCRRVAVASQTSAFTSSSRRRPLRPRSWTRPPAR